MSAAEIEGTLLDPTVQACPFAYHEQLREKAPVYRMPETGFYVVSTYEDLKTVLTDPVTFSNDIEIAQLAGEAAADLGRMYDDNLAEEGWGHVQTLQRTDPPVHGRYRRLINRTLTPSMVSKRSIRAISSALSMDEVLPPAADAVSESAKSYR